MQSLTSRLPPFSLCLAPSLPLFKNKSSRAPANPGTNTHDGRAHLSIPPDNLVKQFSAPQRIGRACTQTQPRALVCAPKHVYQMSVDIRTHTYIHVRQSRRSRGNNCPSAAWLLRNRSLIMKGRRWSCHRRNRRLGFSANQLKCARALLNVSLSPSLACSRCLSPIIGSRFHFAFKGLHEPARRAERSGLAISSSDSLCSIMCIVRVYVCVYVRCCVCVW